MGAAASRRLPESRSEAHGGSLSRRRTSSRDRGSLSGSLSCRLAGLSWERYFARVPSPSRRELSKGKRSLGSTDNWDTVSTASSDSSDDDLSGYLSTLYPRDWDKVAPPQKKCFSGGAPVPLGALLSVAIEEDTDAEGELALPGDEREGSGEGRKAARREGGVVGLVGLEWG